MLKADVLVMMKNKEEVINQKIFILDNVTIENE
jgi:hypothetical protein